MQEQNMDINPFYYYKINTVTKLLVKRPCLKVIGKCQKSVMLSNIKSN